MTAIQYVIKGEIKMDKRNFIVGGIFALGTAAIGYFACRIGYKAGLDVGAENKVLGIINGDCVGVTVEDDDGKTRFYRLAAYEGTEQDIFEEFPDAVKEKFSGSED